MEDLSLHILDIAENSIAAGAHNIRIALREDVAGDTLTMEISDDGKGMTEQMARSSTDPFVTTRTTRKVGLGLPLLKEAAEAAGGTLTVRSFPGTGTTISAVFRLSHIDAKPHGNMAETIAALLATHAELEIAYSHTRNGKSIDFDTRAIRKEVEGAPLDTVQALNTIREYLNHEEDTLAR